MEPRANPIPKRGERNICCPFYNDCLDQAVEGSWQSWDCSQWLIKVKGLPIKGRVPVKYASLSLGISRDKSREKTPLLCKKVPFFA